MVAWRASEQELFLKGCIAGCIRRSACYRYRPWQLLSPPPATTPLSLCCSALPFARAHELALRTANNQLHVPPSLES